MTREALPPSTTGVPRLRGIAYGGDYNPEQWPEEVWPEDVRLMREAGVTLVTVGVFSWSVLESAPGVYDFGWLDRIIGLLHDNGIGVCLATPTASPPPWFSHAHPDSLPVTESGVRLGIGSREAYCPSSPAYREAAVRIATALAERYGSHPSLALWHVNNEYGAHVASCYCDVSAQAFRAWLRRRYVTLAALNTAWGTAFWSQRYGAWDEVSPPRLSPMPVNPAQQLDFYRFSSDEHLACYVAERDAIRPLSPGVPITTNFMATNCPNIDYWSWAGEVDVVANNHYLVAEDPLRTMGLSMSADLGRSLARGRPWLLMEHSTGAVNWQPRNLAKEPGEMRRNSLAHVARGAESVLFFQWRASQRGAEKFHSAMLPHGGTATQIWADVCALGREVGVLGEIAGSTVRAEVALVWDWASAWALGLEYRPSRDLDAAATLRLYYQALWRKGVVVDFVPPGADLSGYASVVVPNLYLMSAGSAGWLARYVEDGGHLLVGFFSGIVDDLDSVHPGPHPGPLADLLGLWIEEFHPLAEGATVGVGEGLCGSVWSERVVLAGAESVLTMGGGPDRGHPALTHRQVGDGAAWYLATQLDADGMGEVLDQVLAEAGVRTSQLPADVELVRRTCADTAYTFVINHGPDTVEVGEVGVDVLTGVQHPQGLSLAGGGVAVLRSTVS
ncbi:beta-galactosidase [Acidothermaceae bacterium B102]|nr:beta-galactosidase [Acidothermaceae bacterium B102]